MAEFLDLYRVQLGVVVVQEKTGGEHHAYALLVAGVAVIGAALLARASGSWPPAAAASRDRTARAAARAVRGPARRDLLRPHGVAATGGGRARNGILGGDRRRGVSIVFGALLALKLRR